MDAIPPVIGEPPPVNRKRWAIHLALVTFYIVAIGVIGMFRHDTDHPALSSKASGVVIVSVIELSIFALFFGGALLASKASAEDLLMRWRHGILPVALGIAYSVGLRILVALATVFVGAMLILTHVFDVKSLKSYLETNKPKVENVLDLNALNQHSAYFWLSVTLVSFVVAGLREELWRSSFLAGTRKLWPKYFSSVPGQIAAVSIGAAIFGFAHLSMGPIAAMAAGLLGLGLGVIMVLHRSIWPAVIAHGCFDATSMIMIPLALEFMKRFPNS